MDPSYINGLDKSASSRIRLRLGLNLNDPFLDDAPETGLRVTTAKVPLACHMEAIGEDAVDQSAPKVEPRLAHTRWH